MQTGLSRTAAERNKVPSDLPTRGKEVKKMGRRRRRRRKKKGSRSLKGCIRVTEGISRSSYFGGRFIYESILEIESYMIESNYKYLFGT